MPAIETLLGEHGYTIAFLGALIEGELVLVLAGLAAHRGYLPLPAVIMFGALGGFVQGEICFAIGRRYGSALFARFPKVRDVYTIVDARLRRGGPLAIAAIRVLYGLRILGPIAVGMSSVSVRMFTVANGGASVLWSAAWACAGYVAGEALTRYFADLKHYERPIFFGVALAAVAVGIVIRWMRHERHKKVLATIPRKP